VLPIWIGPAEASAIAMELAGVKFARPLTHDLLKQLIVGLGAELRKVIITQVKDNTYYAELHIYRGDTVIQIDARPSDSIALALRLKTPIFTSDTLLAVTSVDTGDPTVEPGGPTPLDADQLKTTPEPGPEDFGKFTCSALVCRLVGRGQRPARSVRNRWWFRGGRCTAATGNPVGRVGGAAPGATHGGVSGPVDLARTGAQESTG
jgi:bifunctional DNase/RNase